MAISGNTAFQSAYANQPVGIDGSIADLAANTDEIERVNGEGTAAIAPGRAVMRDTSNPETGCKLPAGASPEIFGVAVDSGRLAADAGVAREYAPGDRVRVLTQGSVWMKSSGTIAAGDPIYIATSGSDQGRPGPASGGGTAPKVSLTLSGGLDDGRARVQTLTFSADLITGNVVDLDIGGESIASVTFATDHETTMGMVVASIDMALANSNQIANVVISDQATLSRVITISSLGVNGRSPTAQAITNAAVTLGASQATITAADQQAGAAPHSLSVTVDGVAVSAEWGGSNDETVHTFAQELQGLAKVALAEVTEVPNGDDLTITLTGANKVANDIDLASGTVSGGAVARTMALDNEVVAGVAATAVLWTGATCRKGGNSGALVKIGLAVLPRP